MVPVTYFNDIISFNLNKQLFDLCQLIVNILFDLECRKSINLKCKQANIKCSFFDNVKKENNNTKTEIEKENLN